MYNMNNVTFSRFETRGYCPARHLANDMALRAELSRAKLLATCAATRPEQARALVANPAGAYMRYASAARYVAELAGGIARARFLGQLG